jgi:hypothetical protein
VVVLRCVEVGWHLIAWGYNNTKELFFQALIENLKGQLRLSGYPFLRGKRMKKCSLPPLGLI